MFLPGYITQYCLSIYVDNRICFPFYPYVKNKPGYLSKTRIKVNHLRSKLQK